MNQIGRRLRLLAVCAGCAVVAVTFLLAPVYALPPRPYPETPTPLGEPVDPSAGAQIQLRAQFSPTWPWHEVHWHEVWTVVQWQDQWGVWRDVQGWQGGLDDVEIEDGVVGLKTWWVGSSDIGRGPFRWVISLGEGGDSLGISEPFRLPDAQYVTMVVEVELAP